MNHITCHSCKLSFPVNARVQWFIFSKCPRCGSKDVSQERKLKIPEKSMQIERYLSTPRRGTKPKKTDMSGAMYLYLANDMQAKTWLEGGGPIPIKPASTYLSTERNGTQTVDENLIHYSNVDLHSLSPAIRFENCKNITLVGNYVDGIRVPDIHNANIYSEDGLVLCFSIRRSADICRKLDKKFCVLIQDMKQLKKIIDEQIGCSSVAGQCEYTTDHQRNHFLKSVEDEWMDEFRLFWPVTEEKYFHLPPGVAKLVPLEWS